MPNEITDFTNLLQIRSSFKKLQQLSWNLTKLEKQFPFDELTPKQREELYFAYLEFVPELENIYDEIIHYENTNHSH